MSSSSAWMVVLSMAPSPAVPALRSHQVAAFAALRRRVRAPSSSRRTYSREHPPSSAAAAAVEVGKSRGLAAAAGLGDGAAASSPSSSRVAVRFFGAPGVPFRPSTAGDPMRGRAAQLQSVEPAVAPVAPVRAFDAGRIL